MSLIAVSVSSSGALGARDGVGAHQRVGVARQHVDGVSHCFVAHGNKRAGVGSRAVCDGVEGVAVLAEVGRVGGSACAVVT